MTIREFINQRDWTGCKLNEVERIRTFGRNYGRRPEGRKMVAEIPIGWRLAAEAREKGVTPRDAEMLCAAIAGYNDMAEWWNPLIRKQLRDAIRRANPKVRLPF